MRSPSTSGGPETVGLSIWGYAPSQNEAMDTAQEREDRELEPLASSTPNSSAKTARQPTTLYPPGLGSDAPGTLDPGVWADLQRKSWSLVRVNDLPEVQRGGLEGAGVRSMLVVSLR